MDLSREHRSHPGPARAPGPALGPAPGQAPVGGESSSEGLARDTPNHTKVDGLKSCVPGGLPGPHRACLLAGHRAPAMRS